MQKRGKYFREKPRFPRRFPRNNNLNIFRIYNNNCCIYDIYRVENQGFLHAPERQKMTEKKQKKRGRPFKDDKKVLVSLRLSPEVLAHMKSTGAGWQTRLDEALKSLLFGK